MAKFANLAKSGVLIALALVAVVEVRARTSSVPEFDDDQCQFKLALTIPEKLQLPALSETASSVVEPTHEALIRMIDGAQKSLRIASFYLKLTPDEENQKGHPSNKPGADVREAIKRAGQRGVDVQIVLSKAYKQISNQADIDYLADVAKVKQLNMWKLIRGGILHTKFLIADNSSFYLGSANFDWQAYSHVKESGLVARDCSELAEDLDKIFRTYWIMSDHKTMPTDLGAEFSELHTKINQATPLVINRTNVYLAGAPPAFNGQGQTKLGRTDDIDAILSMIRGAKSHIDISVMNYSPQLEFGKPKYYWPLIDDALREAAVVRNIRVRLLLSRWANSKPLESMWYKSLNSIQSPELQGGGIHVKLFEVPAFDDYQKSLPYSRVKHDKFMVTDAGLYLGTSNWAPDYFTKTCGVGLVMLPFESAGDKGSPQQQSNVIQTMREIFERDFNSQYAHEL